MINLFVYGSLMSNERNSSFLKQSRFIGEGHTLKEFCMFDSGLDFPFVTTDEVSYIHGELYRVDDEALARIDALESEMFTREEVEIKLYNSGTVKAHMYIAWPEKAVGKLIREGKWR